jgi:hypothetical protein
MKKAILVLVILMVLSADVYAQTAAPAINKIQQRQLIRIHQGIKSGQLTKREVRYLLREQRIIQHNKINAKYYGVVTRDERKRILREQMIASRDINRFKHNGRNRV